MKSTFIRLAVIIGITLFPFSVYAEEGHGGHGHTHDHEDEHEEDKAKISDEVSKLSGIKTEKVGSREIQSTTRVRGKIVPSEHKIAHVIPRFPGIVREGRKHIGDSVKKGEVLAIIESNQSLQPFEVRSQIDGTVINGHVIVGEFVPENQWIYVVADLSEVWADFFIPLREKLSVKANQKIRVSTIDGDRSIDAVVSYVAPYADERSQSQLLRVIVQNPDNTFVPGMFLIGDLSTSEKTVNAAVKRSAIQTFKDKSVVFKKVGETYEPIPVELGVGDSDWVEVLSGLSDGDEYVSENSYLIKADILKSGAEHDH